MSPLRDVLLSGYSWCRRKTASYGGSERCCSVRYISRATVRVMNAVEAEQALAAWASVERDGLVRAAYEAGVSKNRIHTITGIARTTIDRILETSMPQDRLDRLTSYLATFTATWPRPDQLYYLGGPPAMASHYTPKQIADLLIKDAEFKALKIGTFLNTPDGRVLAAAVERLTPPPYREDVTLLVEALQLAAKAQQQEAREAFVKGLLVVAGVSVVAAALGGNG